MNVTRRGFTKIIGLSSAAAMIRRLLTAGTVFPFSKLFAGVGSNPGDADFCLVGDFGAGYFLSNEKIASQNPNALAVAEGIRKFAPLEGNAYVVSLGDQIYEPYDGTPSTDYPFNVETWPVSGVEAYDQTIGELYSPYILFPKGSKSAYAAKGSTKQRFLAILGDHDWWHQPRIKILNQPAYPLNTASYPAQIAPNQPLYQLYGSKGEPVGYTEYFSNQGQGSSSGSCCYWDQIKGQVHWFALSSDPNEVLLGTLANGYYSSSLPGGLLPDGLSPAEQNLRSSVQGKWFRETASASSAPWKFVITHYPPFTSSSSENGLGGHPSATYMQWDYTANGVDAVFSGHVHNYERLYKDGVLYVVNGAGGTFKALAGYVDPPLSISQRRVTGAYGFMTAKEGKGKMTFTYYSVPPQTTLPYKEQPVTVADCFTLLNNGTIKTAAEMDHPSSIIITRGGGTLDLNGFDITASRKLQGVGRLIKKGSGILSLAEANPDFSGILELREGSLRLMAEGALPNTVALEGRGGELAVEGAHHSFTTPLELRGSMTIRLSRGASLHFADSSATAWSLGSRLWISGDTDAGSIRFGNNSTGLTPKQLSKIRLKADPRARFKELGADGRLIVPSHKTIHLHQTSVYA
jgi:Calcineurin-like phosphoesterase